MSRGIGIFGIIVLTIAITLFARDIFNYEPLFMGKTEEHTGYIISNKIVPFFKSTSHKIVYEYQVKDVKFNDHYISNKTISKLKNGDSLKLEVSIQWPSKNKVVGYYR